MGRGQRRVSSIRKRASNLKHISGELIPGQVDDVAREVYTQGQCAYLALALNQQSKAPIWAIVDTQEDPEEIYDPEGSPPVHFGVEINDQILDINGAQDFDFWESAHGGYAVPVERSDVLEWQKTHELENQWAIEKSFEEQINLAKTFIPGLLP